MKPFSKSELIGVTLIFLVVSFFTLFGLKDSLRKGRDAQRRADLGRISDALHNFYDEFGFFPLSQDGKIKMCKGENFDDILAKLKKERVFDRELFFQGLRPCEYGIDSFRDVTDDSRTPFLNPIPEDPKKDYGYSYLYLSNTKRFQIFAYLEGETKEDEYDSKIAARGLICGKKPCSFGKASGDTPLNISIEEYEQILLEKSKTGN